MTTQQQHQENRRLLWLLRHYPTGQLQDPRIYQAYYELYEQLEVNLRDQGVPIGTSEGHDEEVEQAALTRYRVPYQPAVAALTDHMAGQDPEAFLTWFQRHGG